VTCVIAAIFLFNPGSYVYTQSGMRINAVQQLVFYLPLFYVTAAGALLLPFRTVRAHWHAVWFAVFCAAILMGLLRESTLLPTLGDPELDLLAAFVPFVVGTVFLLVAVRSLAAEATAK
jgi:hypothetical protein